MRKGVKKVKSNVVEGTEGTANSCTISFGPHSNPIKAGIVMIDFKRRLKWSRINCLDYSERIAAFKCEMQLANWTSVSVLCLWEPC